MSEKAEPLITGAGTDEEHDFTPLGPIVTIGEAAMSTVTVGLWLLNGIYTVGPRETRLILHNGRLTHIESQPGLHWAPSFGREDKLVTTADIAYVLPELKVVDTTGVPIVVSAVLVYRVVDAKRALLNIDNVNRFVQSQASAALKLVVSQYSYEALKVESSAVQQQVIDALQEKVTAAGVQALSLTLNELNYAPEIAAAMLKKQQAAALVAARELVVEGACQICLDAVKRLNDNGLSLEQADKVRLVSNLLTVVCSEENATPVVNVASSN